MGIAPSCAVRVAQALLCCIVVVGVGSAHDAGADVIGRFGDVEVNWTTGHARVAYIAPADRRAPSAAVASGPARRRATEAAKAILAAQVTNVRGLGPSDIAALGENMRLSESHAWPDGSWRVVWHVALRRNDPARSGAKRKHAYVDLRGTSLQPTADVTLVAGGRTVSPRHIAWLRAADKPVGAKAHLTQHNTDGASLRLVVREPLEDGIALQLVVE